MVRHGLSRSEIESMDGAERVEFLSIANIMEERRMRTFLESIANILGIKRG